MMDNYGEDWKIALREMMKPKEEWRWIMSSKYKGYACCPMCLDTYIEPEWVVDLKWRYCPTCGTKLKEPEVNNG